MRLLRRQKPAGGLVVLVAGEGLIGSAVVNALRNKGAWDEDPIAFRWNDAASRAEDLDRVCELLARAARDHRECAVVWAAGRCGFSANEEEAAEEARIFDGVLEQLRVSGGAFQRRTLHLLSSAGGLFEGCVAVTPESTPKPRRPYGRLKAHQESTAAGLKEDWSVHLYRPASVYGERRQGQRLGLVSTLIENGLRREVSRLFGSMETQRDYVSADDIGRYIASTLTRPGLTGVRTHLLASGRPSSIWEVKRLVERALARQIYVSLHPDSSESRPITFSPKCLPSSGWRPATLETGIRFMVRATLGCA